MNKTYKIIKKASVKGFIALGIVLVAFACKQPTANSQTEVQDQATVAIDPIFTQNPAPAAFVEKFFTGDVTVNMMLKNDENNEYSVANVTFSPAARTNWHTHPKGQVLLVLAGNGFYQAEGEPVQALKKGDVVNIPPHVNHWHGAAPNSEFVHVALTNVKDGKNVTWGAAVTDEQYNNSVQ